MNETMLLGRDVDRTNHLYTGVSKHAIHGTNSE